MSYEDFLKTFDVLYLCHLTADCFLSEIFKSNKVCCFLIKFYQETLYDRIRQSKKSTFKFYFFMFFSDSSYLN